MILKPYNYGAMLKTHGYDLDAFPFDDAYLDKLLGFLGRDRAEVDLPGFAQDHFNLLYAFLQARKIEAETPSITQETKALAKAQDAAWALAAALKAVRDTGEAGKRLIEDSAALPDRRFGMNDLTLAELLAGPDHSPHVPLRVLLFDLRVALQRAKIEKPRKLLPIIDGSNTSAKTRDDRRVRFAAQGDDPEQRYRDRYAEHGRATNFGLTVFARRLWEMWSKYSDRPFTEGRYESAQVNYNLPTVDFAETCLKAFGAKCPRSLIAKRLRQAREQAASEVAE